VGTVKQIIRGDRITQEETAKIIEALSSLATDGEIRRQWVADWRGFAQGGNA